MNYMEYAKVNLGRSKTKSVVNFTESSVEMIAKAIETHMPFYKKAKIKDEKLSRSGYLFHVAKGYMAVELSPKFDHLERIDGKLTCIYTMGILICYNPNTVTSNGDNWVIRTQPELYQTIRDIKSGKFVF